MLCLTDGDFIVIVILFIHHCVLSLLESEYFPNKILFAQLS